MKLATTTGDFARWTDNYEDCIRLIYDAGFRNIDISISKSFCQNNRRQEQAERLRDYASKLGIAFVQAHSPEVNPLLSSEWEEAIETSRRSIEICALLGVPQTVIHAGYREGVGKAGFFSENLDFYKHLFPTMEKTGVAVLTENSTRKNLGEYYYFFTGAEMKEFLEYAGHPLLHAVWDTGHGNAEGTQYEQLMALGKELYGIHVHDNDGNGDDHTLPYFGTLNMDDLIHGLIDADYHGYFTFEAISALRSSNCGEGRRHTFASDTRLFEPTLEMQVDVERLLYTIGRQCLSAYGIFEE